MSFSEDVEPLDVVEIDNNDDLNVHVDTDEIFVNINENQNFESVNKVKVDAKQPILAFKSKPISEFKGQMNPQADLAKGLYILTTYQMGDTMIPIKILLDTGCSHSLLSYDIYQQIPIHMRPKLQETDKKVKFADGSVQKGLGVINMPVNIKDDCPIDFLVGNFSDEAMLGLNDIKRLGLTINAGEMLVTIDDRWLPIHDIHCNLIGRKVLVRRSVVIPPRTQMIIPAYVEKHENEFIFPERPMILDTNKNIIGEMGIFPAKSVHQEIDPEIPVMMYNPQDKSVKIDSDLVVGRLSEIDDLSYLDDHEKVCTARKSNSDSKIENFALPDHR